MSAAMAAVPSPAAPPVRPLRIAMASFIGTAVEWYDYFIYGTAAAIVFGPLFFPKFSTTAGTMAAFATFSVGFLARPLGAVVMGHFGDRLGRKSMLVVSLLTIGVATTCIGLLPTYASVGVLAPALLVGLRFLQGIGVGGEWGGAVLLAVEHAPANRKGFYGSFPQMGVPGGLILANLVFLAVSSAVGRDAFLAWGWRVPFLASAIMVVIGLVIRFKVAESPDFERMKRAGERERMPLVTVLAQHPGAVLLSAGAFIANNAIGYIVMAYLLSYGTTVLGLGRGLLLTCVLIGAVVWLAAIPWASALSDRHGRARVLLAGSAGLTVFALVLFPLVDSRSPALIVTALVVGGVFLGITYGPLAALLSELFPARVRYSGASLGYQIGAIVGGGLAPTVATGLYGRWHSSLPITVYLTGVCLVSLISVAVIARRPAAGA
ncbi:MAG TPA: MFS transporter [Vicinamibacteria bacterium]|jgi:metabolite-proton symporter|nr:MFS transporter [Vicinamibacteria bacterium]